MKTHLEHLPTGRRQPGAAQRGSVLIIVMWIAFGLVALALYFANSMSLEMRASDNRVAALESQQAIAGAACYISNILASVAEPGVMPAPDEYRCDAAPVGDATFWLIGRQTNEVPTADITRPAFGLVDEASKLNLNASWVTADVLEQLPGMTPEFAAAIVDWRDSDSDVSLNGAEDPSYQQLNPPYECKNGPFETVDELRLVYGADMNYLYGEDANLNGILDPNENDGELSPPYDNRDGRLDAGLLDYVTVYSHEPGTGTNVNDSEQLQALLETVLGSQRANEILVQAGIAVSGGGGGGQPGGGGAPGGGGGGGATVPTYTNLVQFYYASGMSIDEFGQVANMLTTSTNGTQGLVNINTASEAVLACIPGISNYVTSVVAYRQSNPNNLTSVAWLGEVLDQEDAEIAGNYITTRSFQFTADIVAVGHHDRGYQRVKCVFDTSDGVPKVVFRQDLTQLGWALGKGVREDLLVAKESQ